MSSCAATHSPSEIVSLRHLPSFLAALNSFSLCKKCPYSPESGSVFVFIRVIVIARVCSRLEQSALRARDTPANLIKLRSPTE